MSDRHSLRCPDPMAICADDLTLRDLALCGGNALGVADVHRLVVADVVEVHCYRMGPVAAVGAAVFHLIGVKPVSDCHRPFVGKAVLTLPVSRLLKALLAPLAGFFRIVGALGAGPLSASHGAKTGFALGRERQPAGGAGELAGCGVFPRRYKQMLPEMFYPCKPDIFEATYEPVEANQ